MFGADDLLQVAKASKELGYTPAFILSVTAFPAVLERDINNKLDELEARIANAYDEALGELWFKQGQCWCPDPGDCACDA